jgi:hypothetical protein
VHGVCDFGANLCSGITASEGACEKQAGKDGQGLGGGGAGDVHANHECDENDQITRTPFRARAGPGMESLTCGYGRGSKLLLVNPLRGEGALVRPATSG